MKKTLHFLLLVLLSLSVQAQTWTASTPAAGTFYLYNIGYDGFLVGSNNWTTRASLTKVGGIPVVLQQADTDNSFYISTSPTYDGRFLGSDGYVDKSNTDNYTAWQFIPVEGQQDTYLLLAKATNNYLVGHDTDATKTSLTTTIPNNERGYWKLATKESLIQNLANATKSAPIDATFALINPHFGLNGTTSVWNGDYWAYGGVDDNKCVEQWNRTFDMYQTITGLPNGVYQMQCQGFYRVGNGTNDASKAAEARTNGNEQLLAYYYINNTEAPLKSIFDYSLGAINNSTYNTSAGLNVSGQTIYVPNSLDRASACFLAGEYLNEPITAVVTDGTIRVGFRKNTANQDDWAAYDNVTLTYLGIDLTALTSQYQSLLQTAQDLQQQPMLAAVKSTLGEAVSNAQNNPNLDDHTWLENNISALSAAVGQAQQSNQLYTGTILPAVNAMKAQSTSDDVKATLDGRYESGGFQDAADVYAQYQALEVAALSRDAGTDYTSLVINHGFQSDGYGWHGGPALGGTSDNTCAEKWNTTFDVYQTITGLPNGYYDMSIQGFYRVGDGVNDASRAAAARTQGTEVLNAVYYLNQTSAPLMSIFNSDLCSTNNSTYNTSAGLSVNGHTLYVPNNMARAAACFSQGAYTNPSIRAVVTDGTLRIGVMKSVANSADWAIWDNVRLTYQGSYTPASYTDVALQLNIENEHVAAYLENTTYTESSTSAIAGYNAQSVSRADQPASANIPLPLQQDAATLYLSLDAQYSAPLTYTIPAGTDLYPLTNFLPGQTYYYKVQDHEDNTIADGTIQTTGGLRMIGAEGIANMRDLGGWVNADGNRIRYGKLFRGTELTSGSHYNATQADLNLLADQLGIGAEIDLRTTSDLVSAQSASSITGATYYYADLSNWSTDALNRDAEKFGHGFDAILAALKAGKAAYFHCIFGADRTGCFAFLLEGLLGLTLDQLCKDYELTSFSTAGTRAMNDEGGILSKYRYINALPGDNLQQKFYNYWRGAVGVSAEDLNAFIDLMVEGTSPITTAQLADLPQPPVANGEYYIYLPKQQQFISRGMNYGTRAVADSYGIPANVTTNGAGVTTIQFLDNNGYLGSDGYTDKTAYYNSVSWNAEAVTDGFVLKSHNGHYLELYTDADGNRLRIDANSAAEATPVRFVSLAEQKSLLAQAKQAAILATAKAAGINAETLEDFNTQLQADYIPLTSTAVIAGATAGSKADWVLSEPYNHGETANFGNAYNVGDYGAELYQKNASVSQTVSVPHPGLYKLSLNAFYRQGSNESCYALGQKGYEQSNAYVSVRSGQDDVSGLTGNAYYAQIPSWYSGANNNSDPNNTQQAKALMNAGRYAVELYAYIGEEQQATITVHVPGFVSLGWCLFNNFSLTEYAKKITVSQDDTATPEACPLASVTLERTLQPGIWNTLSLPFSLTAEQLAASPLAGATIYGFDHSDASSITFADATSIEAGKPYLVQLPADAEPVANPTFTGVSVVSDAGQTLGEDGSVQFVAQTFNSPLAEVADVCYLATDGKVKKLSANGSIKGLRAYFIVPSAQQQGAGVKLYFSNTPTAIQTTTIAPAANGTQHVVDLSGRRVSISAGTTTARGIYIVGGKKVVVK